jgi:hypothetical protein
VKGIDGRGKGRIKEGGRKVVPTTSGRKRGKRGRRRRKNGGR